MGRTFATLLSLLFCAGLLAACENPFAATYAPLTTAPSAATRPSGEIEVRHVDDLAAAEAELQRQEKVKLGTARFRSHWTDDDLARRQAAEVGADTVLIERTDTRVETIEHRETRLEIEHGVLYPGGPEQLIEREVPVYTYETRQRFEIRASFWRTPG